MTNNRKQYELYSMLGEKPIKDAKEIAFAAGRKKFSKLCGFKFQAPNGKEFEMAFIAKMRSHINHQQKKRVGRQWTIPSRWFCISYSDPKNMNIFSSEDAFTEFGFHVKKFFLSELFKHESKKLQDIVFKGIEDAKKFALKMDQGPILKNVLQEIESLELTSELILKDDFEDKTYSITDYSMEKEQISEGWEKYAWKANTKGKLTGENLIKMVLDHAKWNSMTNPIKIYDVHTNHYFDLIDMHVLKNNSGLALDIDTTREASVMESSEEFKKIDDIVAYLKDKKLKWTKVAKFQRINAVLSKGREEVETIGSDGNKETKRKTKNGDWIVNNVSNPDNKWIIDDKTFKKKYEEHKDGVYKPKGGVMLAAKVSDCEEAGVEFAPPNWGGDVIKIQNDGYFMKDPTNGKDIYAISKKDYEATYKELKDIKENKMNKKSKVKILNESSVRPEVDKFFVDMKECDGICEIEDDTVNEYENSLLIKGTGHKCSDSSTANTIAQDTIMTTMISDNEQIKESEGEWSCWVRAWKEFGGKVIVCNMTKNKFPSMKAADKFRERFQNDILEAARFAFGGTLDEQVFVCRGDHIDWNNSMTISQLQNDTKLYEQFEKIAEQDKKYLNDAGFKKFIAELLLNKDFVMSLYKESVTEGDDTKKLTDTSTLKKECGDICNVTDPVEAELDAEIEEAVKEIYK